MRRFAALAPVSPGPDCPETGSAAGFTKWAGYFRSTTFRRTISDSLTTSARSLAFSSISDTRSVSSTSSQAASSRTDDALERGFPLVAGYAFPMTDIPGTHSPPAKRFKRRAESASKFGRFKGQTAAQLQRIAGGSIKYKDEDLLRSLFIVRPGRVRLTRGGVSTFLHRFDQRDNSVPTGTVVAGNACL